MGKIKEYLANIAIIVTWLCAIVCIGVVCISFCREYLKMGNIDSGWVAAIGSIGVLIVTLFLGLWGDRIKAAISPKPQIVIKNVLKTRQQYLEFPASNGHPARWNSCEVYRLEIFNDSVKDVTGIVINVAEIKSFNGVIRSIVPSPFQWTHLNASVRNIAPGQSVYLDFIQSRQTYQNTHPTSFVLPHLSFNPNMINVAPSCFVKIKCYGENIKPKEFNLKVEYQSNYGNFPSIDIQVC